MRSTDTRFSESMGFIWTCCAVLLALSFRFSLLANADSLPTKKANQSSTYGSSTADRAIDGSLSTCSLAAIDDPNKRDNSFAWWQVDLGDIFNVYNVTITTGNNDGLDPQYVQNFTIFVRNDNNTNSTNNVCITFNNGSYVPSGVPLTLECNPNPMSGRYVTIKRLGGFRSDCIGFCEVKITYGTLTSSTSSSTSTKSSSTTVTTTSTSKTSSISATSKTSSLPGATTTTSTTSAADNTSQTHNNTTFAGASSDGDNGSNRNTIIICVVVIIGGLLLLGGGTALFIFLFRVHKGKWKLRGDKTIVLLPMKHDRENPYTNISSDTEYLTKPIRESDLMVYIENKKTNPSSFKADFKKLPEDEDREAKVGRKLENKLKNRFANVIPYDHTLVPLIIEEYDDPEGDYINASYIEGYKNEGKMYIATQGPRPNTLDDFWRLIWQQNVNIILMITSLIEGGKKKCEKYWPENLHSTQTFHKISVTLTVEETYSHYAYREMVVHDVRQEDSEPRIVRQMHFLTWSDKTRPDHFLSLMSFRRKVRALQKETTGPVVVHCSAGIGRTGTYIALDVLLEQLKDEHEVSIFGCVHALRYQRMGMVQTAEQYVFLHEALADGIQAGDTGIACATFAKEYAEMAKPWPDGSLSSLEQQFILLKKLKEFKTEKYSAGAERINISKNRDQDIFACDEGRPYLESTYYNGSDYINAVYADSYRWKEAFVLTQLPLQETIIDFWRLVWDHRLGTIVLLNEIEPDDETSPIYWPEGSVTEAYGPFEVEVMQTNELSSTILVREFTLTSTKEKRKDPLTVTQYQVKGWTNDAPVPTSANLFLELMNILMANSLKDKLVVQCTDGVARSGLFAAAMYVVDMMKVEQVVDVFLACRFVAINRPQIIGSLEQYAFLHDLACTCMMQYEEYDNCQPTAFLQERENKRPNISTIYANAMDATQDSSRELGSSNPAVVEDS